MPTLTTTLRGMVNVVVTVEALRQRDALRACSAAPHPTPSRRWSAMLATLRDEHGNTTIDGLDDDTQTWTGVAYPPEQFRSDAGVLDGVELLGDGSVADMLWARPAATVLGIDCPPVVGSSAAVPRRPRARLNLRIPPGVDREGGAGRARRAPAVARAVGRAVRDRARAPATRSSARSTGPATSR